MRSPLHAVSVLGLLTALLLGSGVPARADLPERLRGFWHVEVTQTTLVAGCTVGPLGLTRMLGAQTLSLWNYYADITVEGSRITARRTANYPPSTDWGGDAPPQAVVDQINALQLDLTFDGTIAEDGRGLSGIDSDWCFFWQGDQLTDHRPMAVPVQAVKLDTAMRALDEAGAEIERVTLGQTFYLEATFSAPITWARVWIDRLDLAEPVFTAAEAEDGGQVFRSAPLTVAQALPAGADAKEEARAGRLYAGVGTELHFALERTHSPIKLPVVGGEALRLSNPRIDDVDLRAAQGELDADIADAERRIADEQREIARQNRALEALAEAARTKDADIQALEAELVALEASLEALAIDRAALPGELRRLLEHRDNLLREKRLAEDRLLAAHDRGDQPGMAFEVQLLDSLQSQLDEANARIRALWAAVPESGDDARPTTPQQLARARRALQDRIDALRPRLVEARIRRGFDETSTQVAREAIAAAEARIVDLQARLEDLRTRRARLDRPFGYVQFIRATQGGETRYEAAHDDLGRLVESFAEMKRALASARQALQEAERLHWRLKQAFLEAAEEVAVADRAALRASWASLAKQFGVEVAAVGTELGFAAMTGGAPGLLIEATSKLAFNIWDIYRGQEPIQNFDVSGLAALVAKQQENDEKQYDADALLDDDEVCRYAVAAGAEAQRLAALEPDLFPSGALFDRYGWPILRESLSMGLKNPATYAAGHQQIRNRIERGLADLDELRRMRGNPVPWLDSMDPAWRDKVDLDRALAAERRAVTNAIDDLGKFANWRRQAAQAGLGLLLSIAVNVGKQKAAEWIRSTEGEAYVRYFEHQLAMTQAWRAYMGSSCLKWKEHDRVERLQLLHDGLLRAYDLELGFVIEIEREIDPALELLVTVPLSQGGGYPLDLVIGGVTGERLGGHQFRFPAGSLAGLPAAEPLPVVVKVLRPQ